MINEVYQNKNLHGVPKTKMFFLTTADILINKKLHTMHRAINSPALQQTKSAFLWENPRLNSYIQKQVLHFFKQINSRSVRSWCIEGTDESLPRVDFSVIPLMHHNPLQVILDFPKEMLPKSLFLINKMFLLV